MNKNCMTCAHGCMSNIFKGYWCSLNFSKNDGGNGFCSWWMPKEDEGCDRRHREERTCKGCKYEGTDILDYSPCDTCSRSYQDNYEVVSE